MSHPTRQKLWKGRVTDSLALGWGGGGAGAALVKGERRREPGVKKGGKGLVRFHSDASERGMKDGRCSVRGYSLPIKEWGGEALYCSNRKKISRREG